MNIPFPAGFTFTTPPKVTLAITRYESTLYFYLAASDLTNTFVIMYNTPGVVSTTGFQLDHFLNTATWVLSYRVITRTSNFAYHLNVANNVNVMSGGTSFSTPTTYNTTKSYSGIASGNLFTTFTPVSGSDYSNIKIITYLSCFGFAGTSPTPPIVYIDT